MVLSLGEVINAGLAFIPGVSTFSGLVRYGSFDAKADNLELQNKVEGVADEQLNLTGQSVKREIALDRRISKLALLEMIPIVNIVVAFISAIKLGQVLGERDIRQKMAKAAEAERESQSHQDEIKVKEWIDGQKSRWQPNVLQHVEQLDTKDMVKLIDKEGFDGKAFGDALSHITRRAKKSAIMERRDFVKTLIQDEEAFRDPVKYAQTHWR